MLVLWWLLILCGVGRGASNYEKVNSWVWQSLGGLGHIELINPEFAFMITDDGLLSTFKIDDGSIKHRYHYNEQNKHMTKITDSTFAVYGQRKLDIWKVDILEGDIVLPGISKQYTLDSGIVSVNKIDDTIYVFDKKHLYFVDNINGKLISLLDFDFDIQYTKLTKNLLTDTVIFFVQNEQGDVFYSDLEKRRLHAFHACKIPDLQTYVSIDVFAICSHSASFILNEDFQFVADTNSLNLVTSTVSANDIIGQDVVSIESFGRYQVIESASEIFLLNTDISESSYINSAPIPESYADALKYYVLFENELNHVYLFIYTSRNVLECHKDGSLIWSFDQSFTQVKEAVSVFDDDLLTHRTEQEVSIITQLFSFFTSLYQSFFDIEDIDDDQSFGFDKKLIVLASNNKIGVFNLQKQEETQLSKTIDLGLQIQDIKEIDNKVFLFSNNNIFELNVELGSIKELVVNNSEFPIFELNNIKKGYTLQTFDNEVHGISYDSGSVEVIWRQHPEGELVALLKRSYDNSQIAQIAVVLQDRNVLYKYLVPNLAVILTKRDGTLDISLTHAITGQTVGKWSKNYIGPIDKINGVYEENYIILSLPYNGLVDETELVVIDLYESLNPNTKLSNPNIELDDFNGIILPSFAMQSFIIGEAVDSIAITSTKFNIAQRALAIQIQGAVYVIPKAVIDGRRGGYVGDLNEKNNVSHINSHKYTEKITHQWKYEPVLHLSSDSQVNKDMNNVFNNNSHMMFTETNLASTSYLVSLTEDIFVTKIQPSGSFDKLTDNFQNKVIASTIITLLILIFYFKTKTTDDVKWVI